MTQATSRDDVIKQDVADLHKLGYAQELFRSMGGFSNFAISFSIISILTGAVILYDYGLAWAGTAAVMISGTVAPWGPASSARTTAFLVPGRGAVGGAAQVGRGTAAGSRIWMAFQIRCSAVLRSVNFLTAITPGREFQRATKRPVGHGAESWVSSARLEQTMAPAVTAAWASDGEA